VSTLQGSINNKLTNKVDVVLAAAEEVEEEALLVEAVAGKNKATMQPVFG
jgi:hypothetical protein